MSSWAFLWVCAWDGSIPSSPQEPVPPILWEQPDFMLARCLHDCGRPVHRAAGSNFLSWCSQYKALSPHHPGCVLFSVTYFLTGLTLLMGSHTPDSPFPPFLGQTEF